MPQVLEKATTELPALPQTPGACPAPWEPLPAPEATPSPAWAHMPGANHPDQGFPPHGRVGG